MCEQCNANPLSYGEIIPGWTLMRARQDGIEWRKDEWALVWVNDPTFTWSTTPTPDPLFGIDDEAEQEAWFEKHPKGTPEYERTMATTPDDFIQTMKVDPALGYDLVMAAMTKGYDPAEGGDFHQWFFDYIGEYLKTAVGVGHDEIRS